MLDSLGPVIQMPASKAQSKVMIWYISDKHVTLSKL
jgi:hypothetical protein